MRTILHSDLNNFYASVECLRNPEIRNFPVVVVGSKEDRHGIVLAKNMIAKGYGVKTGDVYWDAKQKCGGTLVEVQADFSTYINVSREVRKIYEDYADRIEAYGIDECWLDVSSGLKLFGSGREIAEIIRERIKKEIGLTIKSILQNEKYMGDSHLQKTYLPDFLSPRRIKNEGQADSYYVEDSHAAIISKEMFGLVQQEFIGRTELRSSNRTGHGKYSGKYAFSGMIICGECGETYRRHQQYNAYKKYYIWVCKRHENTGKENCRAKPISEEALERAFVRALNSLIENREEILDELQLAVMTQMSDSCESEVAEVDAEIQNSQNRIVDLLMDKNGGRLTEKEYERQTQLLKFQIDELNLKKEIMLNEQGKMQLAEYRADAVTDLLQTGKILDEFDKTIFKSLVRQIKVVGDKKVEFEFECGIKVTESL